MKASYDRAPQPDLPVYGIPSGVRPSSAGGRPLLTTPQGGQVVVDGIMLQVWQHADGRTRQETQAFFKQKGLQLQEVSAALACLASAGLLSLPEASKPVERPDPLSHRSDSLVSVVIVSYNSLTWLPGCLASLRAQSHTALELIVIDNGSSDASTDWLAEHHPDVTLVCLEQTGPLSAAINRGVEAALGEFILLLNPDVVLDPQAVSHLIEVAQGDTRCAAIAAKLRLLWTPAFLNGLGNLVGAFSWGTDSALGHLDLGQFDHWTELPSACFAAALLPAVTLHQIGPLDDGLPMYYEDSEWCYRARLFGYTVRLAPQAVVYHAFSGRAPAGAESGLGAVKLQRVVYGRLRFITRLLRAGYFLRFFIGYLIEDVLNGLACLVRGRWGHARAYWLAWMSYFASLRMLRSERKILQGGRRQNDQELFRLQRTIPAPLIWRGLPLLTWDVVCHEYMPWLEARKADRSKMTVKRALTIWRVEGFAALAHRVGRRVLWKWMQP